MESKSQDCEKVDSKGQCKRSERRILKVDKWFIKGRRSQISMCDQFKNAYLNDDQLALEELQILFEHSHCLCCGYTLLHLAVNVVSKELVGYCLSRNFDVEATNDNEETALHLASALDDPWFVEQLLNNKADVNAIDGLGCTPLQICLISDKPSPIILKNLLRHGAKPNKLFSLDDEQVEGQLAKMIKANARNSSGVFPLYEAVCNGDYVVAEKLLADGACPKSLNCYRRSLLQIACYNDSFGCVKTLLKAGVDVNDSDLEGRTALHYAIIIESEEIVELLLQYECDLWLRDSDGFTALEMAAFTNRWRATEQLLSHGAKCTEMLLLEALERRCTEVSISILCRGYFRVHDTEFGLQLMECAVTTEQQKVVRLLQSVGVRLECEKSNDKEEVSVRPSEKVTARLKPVNRVTFCNFVECQSMGSDMNGQIRKQSYVSPLHSENSRAHSHKQMIYGPSVGDDSQCEFAERSSMKRTFSSSKELADEGVSPKNSHSENRPNFAKQALSTTDSAVSPKVQSFFKSLCKEPASHRSNVDSLFHFYCEKQFVYDEIWDKTLYKNEMSDDDMATNVDMFFKFYKHCVN